MNKKIAKNLFTVHFVLFLIAITLVDSDGILFHVSMITVMESLLVMALTEKTAFGF